MDLEDWWRVASIVAQSASALAIVAAAIGYSLSRDQRSGETLLQLEQGFKQFWLSWQVDASGPLLPGITRAVDREAHEQSNLRSAITKGFDQQWDERDPVEKAWVSRLDEFLRFLLLVAVMEKNRLLKKGALWDAYHYWFRMVATDELIRRYVCLYFPGLEEFLKKNKKEIDRYESTHRAAKADATRKLARPAVPP
jgi:hypothetical protein